MINAVEARRTSSTIQSRGGYVSKDSAKAHLEKETREAANQRKNSAHVHSSFLFWGSFWKQYIDKDTMIWLHDECLQSGYSVRHFEYVDKSGSWLEIRWG